MKTTRNTLLILLVIISMVVAGCSKDDAAGDKGKDSEGQKKITVLMPKHEMDNQGFMEAATRDFERETGIKVELINMSWDSVADKITAEMATNGDSYDVIEFDNSWVAKFPTNNWIVPLDDYVTDEMKNGILPGLLDKFSHDGKLYGIPWNNDTRFFMYNKKKLNDAGIKEPPKTWAELEEQSKILKEKGLVKYGFIDSYMQGQPGTNELTYAVYSFGGDFFDKDGNLTVTSDPGVKKAYEFLKRGLNDDKFIDPASVTSNYETVAEVFAKGDTAFFLQAWPGVYQMANDPELSNIVGEIAIAPYSIGVDEASSAVLTLPEAMAIPSTSKNKDEAWEYIKYMSSKAFDKKKAQTLGALPVWTDLFQDADLLEVYPYWKDFGAQSLKARGLQDLLWYDQFSNLIQIESLKILLNQVSVDEGLKNIEEQAKQFMQ